MADREPSVPPDANGRRRAGPPDAGPGDLVAGLEADLRALAAADADLERDAEVAERTRIERAAVSLAERLAAATGSLELTVVGGARQRGTVADVGEGWVLLASAPQQGSAAGEHLVRLGAVMVVRGLERARSAPHGGLPPRSLASVLRSWCRDRADVAVLLLDGRTVVGRASASYADHMEIGTDVGPVALPFEAVAVVTR